MMKFIKRGLWSVIVVGLMCLTGCVSEHGEIYQGANHTVQRLSVGPIGEYDSKTVPHALGAAGSTFGEEASQYRWVHVQGITKVDRNTWLHTIARVPDQVPQLHRGDIVDVVFLTIPDSNYDQFQTAVVLRVVCKDEGLYSACKRKLYVDAGHTGIYLGPTGEDVPSMGQYTFSKFYDKDGNILPGAKLPQ
jgi:hypothetical protein